MRQTDREEGLIVGPSTGAVVHAAAELAESEEAVAVAVSPDSGFEYASFLAGILGDEGKPKG
jgi:cysteine synthase A